MQRCLLSCMKAALQEHYRTIIQAHATVTAYKDSALYAYFPCVVRDKQLREVDGRRTHGVGALYALEVVAAFWVSCFGLGSSGLASWL